jgi:hypothetical protein
MAGAWSKINVPRTRRDGHPGTGHPRAGLTREEAFGIVWEIEFCSTFDAGIMQVSV